MKAYIIPFLLLCTTSVFAQSNTTKQLKQTYTDSNFTYLYGSVIRASVNLTESKALVDLIKNLDLIVYSKIELSTKEKAQATYHNLLKSLQIEEFEHLFQINEGQTLQKIQSIFDEFSALTLKEKNDHKQVFLAMRLNNSVTILDITGSLNKENITAKDISQLLNLYNELNKNQLINISRSEGDAKNNKSN